MIDVTELVGIVFSGLSALVIEDVEDAGEVICVRARTRDGAVACPGCGAETARVHELPRADGGGRAGRRPARPGEGAGPPDALPGAGLRGADVPRAGPGRPGALPAAHRPADGAGQRGGTRISGQGLGAAAARAGHHAPPGIPRCASCCKIPLPALAVPRVLGIDDFALRRGSVYATVLIDAETGRRVDVVAGRTADVAEKWLRDHPGAEVVCRDGSGAYGEAVRRALPGAVQVSDRWHLWHSSARPSGRRSRRTAPAGRRACPLQDGKRAATTAERWQQVHELRARNVGLLECARRLGLSLNTVKRYDRASEPERLQRVPKYRPTLVDPYRDYLRKRRADEPGVPVQQLLREIRERGYQGSSNLLVRYINQGRLDSDRPHLSPRRAARILLTRPDRLTGRPAETLARLEAACPEMTALTSLITLLRRPARPGPGQRRQAPAVDHRRARRRPAPPALLHPGPRPGHPGRHGGAHPAVPQRPHRGSQHQDQDDQKADVRTRRLHPAPPPDPPRLRPRTVTTESATEPSLTV